MASESAVDGSRSGAHTRVGLFGGTFDPVHYGHLRPAVEMAEQYQLSKLYLLPNHRPVHRGPTAATTDCRIDMLKIALQDAPRLQVDTREALRDKPSYTFDTLCEIHAEQPEATLLFFMGMDAFAAFDTWHDWEGILNLANLVIVGRPEAEHSDFSARLVARQQERCGHKIESGGAGVIELCEVTQMAISATDVRRRIANEQTVRFLLPEQVLEYIGRNNLYRKSQ
ncbi:nicotinate-nucleotide adenylyltransferase [Granulosicoccus antarcticus]|uniref:Probable nicotinate-nucleotide adenylyltransferase n=1 Tax=Granulosicoccus antarcticus IMCC3135 TaxID=1192854 RepID=A0A2Z2NXX5_9GAMM|nr:nicotinate-nucleotide adenylyltransferase [Granulosicoccus antarcticus]ASJ76129.1 putative nicotinate-nucleotide adenylyltransferase [Granulosicoccus antarcticus IMCC3135]